MLVPLISDQRLISGRIETLVRLGDHHEAVEADDDQC